MELKSLSLSFLIACALADIAPPAIPNCGLPADTRCLVRNAQYTVVGTIRSTNLGESGSLATPGRYNATMNIRCMWSSFTNPPSDGNGLVGKDVLVTNWGFPKIGCPPNTGARAAVGDTMIYFLYVGKTFANSPPESTLFSVQSICVGGVDATSENAQIVADVLGDVPDNAIPLGNRGSEEFCTLPGAVTGTGNGGRTGSTFTPPNQNNGKKVTIGAFVAFVVAGVILTF